MKLSSVLEQYLVIPLHQSEVVGFTVGDDLPEEDGDITISWKDSDTGVEHFQVFDDQEIKSLQVDPPGGLEGAFTVVTTEGEVVAFIALAGASRTALFAGEGADMGRAINYRTLDLQVDGCYLHMQVGKFSVQVKHEDEGIVIDVYAKDGSDGECLATLCAEDPQPEEG